MARRTKAASALDIVADPGTTNGDSTWRVRAITWSGVKTSGGSGTAPPAPFYPVASSLDLRLPAVELIAATKAATNVSFHKRYIDYGLDAGQNPGALVAAMTTSPIALGFANKGDRSGGLIRPDLSLTGLSRTLGPIGGPNSTTSPTATSTPPTSSREQRRSYSARSRLTACSPRWGSPRQQGTGTEAPDRTRRLSNAALGATAAELPRRQPDLRRERG